MLKEATSHLKNKIKDPVLQARAIKLLESSFSYIELDEKKQANDAKKKELAKAKEAKAKKPIKEGKND